MEAQYDKSGIHVSDQWNCKYSKMKFCEFDFWIKNTPCTYCNNIYVAIYKWFDSGENLGNSFVMLTCTLWVYDLFIY